MDNIKTTAIPFSGYEYQNLQGALILAQWLENPPEYHRVRFEASGKGEPAPRGTDDIVCERPDGKTDFYQIKFTPNPYEDNNSLSWDWLLERNGTTKRSLSILKKISDAIDGVSPEKLGRIILRTNKKLDRLFELSLRDFHVDYAGIDDGIRKSIVEQLGNETAAQKLFSILEFHHSDLNLGAIQNEVQNKLSRYSETSISRLLSAVKRWFMYADQPSENGWIELHHVTELLSDNRPKPISQSFVVPDNYCLPDAEFHQKLFDRICQSSGEAIVLTGTPGSGKSTYLSFLYQELRKDDTPVIRHHYFLSIRDSNYDRLHYATVSGSLLLQIARIMGSDANSLSSHSGDLRQGLEECASYCKSLNKRFVVIIDGLDHVWRDNAGDKKPLDHLFNQLLPVPDNLVLVIGTQSVDEYMLPNILLEYCNKEKWEKLPPMTGKAIYEYLKHQLDSERLYMPCNENMRDIRLSEIARLLTTITSGYPLHVIYSCEYLAQNGMPLSDYNIEELPACESADIRLYYKALWGELTNKQKDVLHLCCAFSFNWPRDAFAKLIDDTLARVSNVQAVVHMLYESKAGLRPFHESLIVFVKKQTDHKKRIDALIKLVCKWLEESAPVDLRESWYWSCLVDNGDSLPLRQGVTRDWVLDRLTEGYPVTTGIRLLGQAEKIAFEERQFAEAYKHRTLKTRLLNGPRFQVENAHALRELSLAFASPDLLKQKLSYSNDYSIDKLAILSISLWHRKYFEDAKNLAQLAIEKHRIESELRYEFDSREAEDNIKVIIKAGVLSDAFDYDRLFKNSDEWLNRYLGAFTRACLIKEDLSLLMLAHKLLSCNQKKASIEAAIIRLGVVLKIDLLAYKEFSFFTSHPLSGCFKLLRQENVIKVYEGFLEDYYSAKGFSVDMSYRAWFFSCLKIILSAQGDFCWLPIKSMRDRMEVSDFFSALIELAHEVSAIYVKKKPVDFATVSELLLSKYLPEGSDYEGKMEVIFFKKEWLKIAVDCHLIFCNKVIDHAELSSVLALDFYRIEWIREWYKKIKIKLFTDEAAKLLVESDYIQQSGALERTIEYSTRNLELASIAHRHQDEKLLKRHLRLCWDYVIGYCHHKDTTIFDVLSAIECLSIQSPRTALELLKRISPVVYNVSNFTDGDETHHAISEISSLLQRLNLGSLASKYKQEIEDGEWCSADQTLLTLIKNSSFDSAYLKRLCLTGLTKECYTNIFESASIGNTQAQLICQQAQEFFGIDQTDYYEDKEENNLYENNINVDLGEFPPEKFNELRTSLIGKYPMKEFWMSWYDYWIERGVEQELLQMVPSALNDVSLSRDGACSLYDRLFASTIELEGKRNAFKYLIDAQIAMNGWSSWYESKIRSLSRLKLVSEHYPSKVYEFISKTTKQDSIKNIDSSDLIIPSDKLVYLLTVCGESEKAEELTEAMVECLESDTRNLRLTSPPWDWQEADDFELVIVRVLIARLGWPVASIKLWVSQQLAEILVESPSKAEALLLAELASRRLEAECVEVLIVFWIARNLGYQLPANLGSYINARSILSDMILRDILLESSEAGNFATSVDASPNIPPTSQLEQVIGRDIPQIYLTVLGGASERTGIPLVDIFETEWSQTFEYEPPFFTDIRYFFGSALSEMAGNFYTKNSHRGSSAYLKALETARTNHGMSTDDAEQLAVLALPIEPAFLYWLPKKPSWLPDWVWGTSVMKEHVEIYIDQCVDKLKKENPGKVLAALSFSVKVAKDTWIDFKFTRGICVGNVPDDFKPTQNIYIISSAEKLGENLDLKIMPETVNTLVRFRPVASQGFSYDRFGHWFLDLYRRGLYFPLAQHNIILKAASYGNSQVEFIADQQIIGQMGYWHSNWSPAYPKLISSVCGTYTLLEESRINNWLPKNLSGNSYILCCSAKLVNKEKSYLKYQCAEEVFFIKRI